MKTVVSFILVNFRTPQLCLQCIQSVKAHTLGVPYEIIVVDNASTETSAAALQAVEGIRLIRNAENPGFGRANNQGAAAATGDYLFFLNTDTWLLNDAATLLTRYLGAHPGVGCCGADLFTAGGQKQVAYGNFPSLSETIAGLGFHRFFPRYYRRHLAIGVRNEHTVPQTVDYVSGAAMCIRRSLFLRLGGFDPDFFLYFEETELAWRLKKTGYQSVLVPAAHIVHLEGGSHADAGRAAPKLRQFTASRKLYFRKTKGRLFARLVTGTLAIRALVDFAVKRDPHYLKVFRILVQS